MNIVVCVKQVPAIEQVKLDPVTKTLVREGVDLRTNSLDRRALTQAIKLREEQGGTVTVITMGPPQARTVLDEALAFADRLAKGATLAIRFAKIAVQRAVLQSVFNSMDLGLALEAMTGQSRDHNEAVTAFREKRRPTFEGR